MRIALIHAVAVAMPPVEAGAAGILYTCSAFGDEIDAVKRRSSVPALTSPNSAMVKMKASF